MELENWESSSGEASDSDLNLNDEEAYYTSGYLPKLQFRSCASKARWNENLRIAEVVEKKGKIWTTTGIVQQGKTYCFIEEILLLAEIGALLVVDDNDVCLSLEDLYGKMAEEKSGCCWDHFEAYKHLKNLGYIVGRYGVPFTRKHAANNSKSTQDVGLIGNKADDVASITEMFITLQVDELRPFFEVYLPNGSFRKSSPGDPTFLLCLTRERPPSEPELEALERRCGGVPLKFCQVEHGRVSFFSFDRVELPTLP